MDSSEEKITGFSNRNVYKFLALQGRLFSNSSGYYAKTGEPEKALEYSLKANEIYQKLVYKLDFPTFLPELAVASNNLSNRYRESGYMDDALTCLQTSIAILEKLVTNNASAFSPDLGDYLYNLGNHYSQTECFQDAVEPYKRAVKIFTTLAEREPQAFQFSLVQCLNNSSLNYCHLKKHEEAIQVSQEAFALGKKGNFPPVALARLLFTLAVIYLDTFNLAEYLSHAQEALYILANAEPEATDLAETKSRIFNHYNMVKSLQDDTQTL